MHNQWKTAAIDEQNNAYTKASKASRDEKSEAVVIVCEQLHVQ